jgi:hypothetical protein
MCWPAGAAGAFFSALIVMDIVQKDYAKLPFHGILGICVTGILWLLCELIGVSITMAILLIPTIFAAIFLLTVWFMNESMKARGCCMTCDKKGTGKFVKRDTPLSKSPSPPMTGLVDSGKGLVKDTIFITDGTPTLLPEFIKKYLPGQGGNLTASPTCINNKLTATPTV